MQERQQLTGARNTEWVIIDSNQTMREKFLRPFISVHLGHVVHAFGEISTGPASDVNYPLIGAGLRQPYHLLDNLRWRKIPRDFTVPHEPVRTIRARLRFAGEEAMRAGTARLQQE